MFFYKLARAKAKAWKRLNNIVRKTEERSSDEIFEQLKNKIVSSHMSGNRRTGYGNILDHISRSDRLKDKTILRNVTSLGAKITDKFSPPQSYATLSGGVVRVSGNKKHGIHGRPGGKEGKVIIVGDESVIPDLAKRGGLKQRLSEDAKKKIHNQILAHEFDEVQLSKKNKIKKLNKKNLLNASERWASLTGHASPDVILREHNRISSLGKRKGDNPKSYKIVKDFNNSLRSGGVEEDILAYKLSKFGIKQLGDGPRLNRRQRRYLEEKVFEAMQSEKDVPFEKIIFTKKPSLNPQARIDRKQKKELNDFLVGAERGAGVGLAAGTAAAAYGSYRLAKHIIKKRKMKKLNAAPMGRLKNILSKIKGSVSRKPRRKRRNFF